MLLGLRTVIYRAPDLARAKAWYSALLGVAPYFDEPFYVAPRDPRLWVPKRPPGIGWTLNFARRTSWLVLFLLLVVPLVTALVGVVAGRGR